MKPRLLDLFCGAGGCTKGYQDAGFEVFGVDIKEQPNYCGEGFVQDDALAYLHWLIAESGGPYWLRDFTAIHASPPCQHYAGITKVSGSQEDHPDLIGPTRDLLRATGLPYVIENVADARRALIDPVLICGSMFDPPMDVRRHRYFETNWPLSPPTWPCRHKLWDYRYPTHDKRKTRLSRVVHVTGGGQHGPGDGKLRRAAMGVDWMTGKELNQAIPPAYTELIGAQLLDHLRVQAAA